MLTHRLDGSGPPLVLLNGGLMTISSWDAIAADLARDFRLIRFDFRGQLLTPGPFPQSLEEHAADVRVLLDQLGVPRAHLMGTSFGGEVALILAAIAPERVETLTVFTVTDQLTDQMRRAVAVLKEPSDRGDGAEVIRLLLPHTFSQAFLATLPPDYIEQRARVAAALPREFFNGLSAILDVLTRLDLSSYLPRITAPTLIMGAELDQTFPPEHSAALANAIRGARLEILPASGHGAVLEQPARIIELFRSFVSRQSVPV